MKHWIEGRKRTTIKTLGCVVLLVFGWTEAFHLPRSKLHSRRQQLSRVYPEKHADHESRRTFFTTGISASLASIFVVDPPDAQAFNAALYYSVLRHRSDKDDVDIDKVYFGDNKNIFYEQLRLGKTNGKVVENGSVVHIESIIQYRDSSNDVNYLSTKKKVSFTVGNNNILPKPIEAGIIGMNEIGIRKIAAPARVVFPWVYTENPLIPNTAIAKERVSLLLVEDRTICFEIHVTSID